jgi:hypothetical protein
VQMLRNLPRPLRYLAPIALVAFLSAPQLIAQTQTRTVAVASAPLSLSLTADSNVVTACADGGAPHVKLKANAVSPGGFPIKYTWNTSAGTISGEGPEVTWNLAGLEPGYHKASLDIRSIGSEGSCQAFSSVTVLVNACAPVQPLCPNIDIVCPTNAAIDQPLTFKANVTGGLVASPPVYAWTVSAGTIVEGQGTGTIKVDTTGLAGQTVRASLSMGGYNLECSAACGAVTIPLPRLISRQFDDFPDISRNDEKARLDNFGIELQNDPTATAYVIVYPGRSSKRGDVQHHSSRIVEYLVHSRGLDERRIVTLVGPVRDALFVELWVTPQGATPPNPQ